MMNIDEKGNIKITTKDTILISGKLFCEQFSDVIKNYTIKCNKKKDERIKNKR